MRSQVSFRRFRRSSGSIGRIGEFETAHGTVIEPTRAFGLLTEARSSRLHRTNFRAPFPRLPPLAYRLPCNGEAVHLAGCAGAMASDCRRVAKAHHRTTLAVSGRPSKRKHRCLTLQLPSAAKGANLALPFKGHSPLFCGKALACRCRWGLSIQAHRPV